MSEDREQIEESVVASETEAQSPVDENQPGDSSPETLQEELVEDELLEDEVAEWADEEDLQALAEEQAERQRNQQEVEDVAPVEENLDVGPAESRVEERPLDWYILKVQSNREDSIAAGLQRRVKMAGLDEYFQDIVVPVEMVTEFKGGKKRIVKKKLYPGYIVVHMIINDETWFLVRETPGIGDFTGAAGQPTPMMPSEVARIVPEEDDVETQEPKLKIGVDVGDRVKINEGTFENFEGDVDTIDEMNGRVTVMINIFGRSTPVELEHWQIEKL
ncbi:MAG: transcription termination/antitermination protein NusG [Pirellulales bacterium]|nr:transcription termination/antitermination protein NusG [Pirellulales bacterium]